MEIWLDSYNVEILKEAKSLGCLHGITTNPLLLSKSPLNASLLLQQLLKNHEGPIAAQVTAMSAPEMLSQGKILYAHSNQLLIKIPATLDGFKAMQALKELSIPVMATAIYETKQALLAFQAGAAYAALYLGRIEDTGKDPFKEIISILSLIKSYYPSHKLLVASLRTKEHFLKSLELGVHAVTLKEDLFSWLIEDSQEVKSSAHEFSTALPPNWLVNGSS